MKKNMLVVLFIFSIISGVVHASGTDEVVITGSRMIDDYDIMPAVTVKRQADFLVQNVRLINDSRSPELRKEEIIGTIDNLLKSSKRMKGIELSYGEGFLMPVNLNDDSLQLIEDRRRIDTSHVDIFVKVALDDKKSAKTQIASLRKFIAKTKLVSRTEIEVLGDIGLSIVHPEQDRYEILKKIVAENNKIKNIVGGNCETTVNGLEGRVQWDRSDITTLTMYIGYGTELKCG
ncbi:MAG: hypothetical protein KUG78_04115 [Kangiellaceae bacterium]|nr:hypothetical protein [Kangiellaceae bacterium]